MVVRCWSCNFAIINKNQRTVVILEYGTSIAVINKGDLLRSTGFWKSSGRATIGAGKSYRRMKLITAFNV